MKNRKLASFHMPINNTAQTSREKYAILKGQPFTINLVTLENTDYIVSIIYNFAIEDIALQVYSGTTQIQGNTIVNTYPTNLLLCNELNEYGLFYNSILSVFDFYYLEDWYNLRHNLSYYELLEFFKTGSLE